MAGTRCRRAKVWFLTAVALGVGAGAARGQAHTPAPPEGLVPLIPPGAVLYVERRGHEAVREVFLKSNLGRMAQDEAINQFVHASRVRIGRMIVEGLFDLQDPDDIDRHQKLLHELLKPFWYNPSAAYVVLDEQLSWPPGLGFICMPGQKHRKGCADALQQLMKVGVPPRGQPGTRQAFTYDSGMIVWDGVAKGHSEFTLPPERKQQVAALKERSVFLTSWGMPPLLLVATDLKAADAMESVLKEPARGKELNPAVKTIMQKTTLPDWAFRWHADVQTLMRLHQARFAKEGDEAAAPLRMMAALGLDKVRSMGGTGGYADNVFVRLTYVDAPAAGRGLTRIFKPGASYKPALTMTPSESTFALAGRVDTQALLAILRESLLAAGGVPATQPAVGSAPARELPEGSAKVLKQLELLAGASRGDLSLFVTDLQAMVMGMFGAGGVPVGAVLDLTDPQAAAKALDELVKLAGEEGGGGRDEQLWQQEGRPARPREYRGVSIRYLGEMVRLAALKDRVVMALGDTALKAGIDTALDKTGGFVPGGKAEALAKPLGDAPAIFTMDLQALTKLGWPMLMQAAEGLGEDFPLASMPSTNKMVRMLGPEVVVIRPDDGGLLLASRGQIPFATKLILLGVFCPMMAF